MVPCEWYEKAVTAGSALAKEFRAKATAVTVSEPWAATGTCRGSVAVPFDAYEKAAGEAASKTLHPDMDLEAARQAARALADIRSAIAVAVDVANEDQVNAGVDRTVATFGRVDVLVSNAGIQIVHPIEDFPFPEWRRMLAIHLDGAFLTTTACLKHMYKQNSGAVIYMGSVHSYEASRLTLKAASPIG